MNSGPNAPKSGRGGYNGASMDMLALAAVLFWLGVIVCLSWFRAEIPVATWIKLGIIGSIPVYAAVFFLSHAIVIVTHASRGLARAKQEEAGRQGHGSRESIEQTEVVDGAE